MQATLIKIDNSFVITIPNSIVNQFNLEYCQFEIMAKQEGVFLKPIAIVPPLSEWDNLFKKAKQQGFNAKDDRAEFFAD